MVGENLLSRVEERDCERKDRWILTIIEYFYKKLGP